MRYEVMTNLTSVLAFVFSIFIGNKKQNKTMCNATLENVANVDLKRNKIYILLFTILVYKILLLNTCLFINGRCILDECTEENRTKKQQ